MYFVNSIYRPEKGITPEEQEDSYLRSKGNFDCFLCYFMQSILKSKSEKSRDAHALPP